MKLKQALVHSLWPKYHLIYLYCGIHLLISVYDEYFITALLTCQITKGLLFYMPMVVRSTQVRSAYELCGSPYRPKESYYIASGQPI